MELLWYELCANAGDIRSPAWHGDELARRDAALGRGEAPVEDWDTARQRIGDAVR